MATLEGVVHKVAVFPRGTVAAAGGDYDRENEPAVCLVEALSLSERPRPGLVRSLQLHAAKVRLSHRLADFISPWAFYYSAPQVWNCLGTSTRSANTFSSFRCSLKSELFAAAYDT